MLKIRRVVGESMVPGLGPGAIILLGSGRHLEVGDVITFKHQGHEKIKRITRLSDEAVFVEGDNKASSTDSRHFGWIDRTAVVGKVIWPRT